MKRRRADSSPGAIFTVVTAGFFLSMFHRVSTTVISPELTVDLQLSATQLSTLSALFFYSFALVQIPLGLALDRWGPRLVLAVLGMIGVVGTVLFAMAGGYWLASLARILLGIGMAGNLMGAFALLVNWFPADRFATLMGALTAAGTLGMMVAATPLALLVDVMGWRTGMLLMALVGTIQAAAILAVVQDRPAGTPNPQPQSGGPLRGLGRLARMPAFWVIGLATFFRFGAFMTIQGLWAGPYLIYGLGMEPVRAGNVLLACSLGYMIGLPLSGRLSDKVLHTRKYCIVPSLFVFALLIATLALVERGASDWLLVAIFFSFGMLSAPGQIMYAHIKELTPPGMAGTSMTGINFFNMLGPAVLLQAAALFIPHEVSGMTSPELFTPVWLFLSGGLLLSGVLYLLIADSRAPGARSSR
jgi:predicted MFS family arabinose efflux permease